ncbi:MAG TPA: hypothetical protein VGI69_04550 [Gaiellaceae bacterium]|jgi:hypothetical protein
MLTLFTIPKPFRGHIGEIQRNAIESWRALRPAVQIVLVGDEAGVQQAAREADVEHVGGLATNERGTPRLDSAIGLVEAVATHPVHCLVNADVVLLDDFLPAVERVRAAFERFLMVGECRDLDTGAGLRLEDPVARRELRERALASGRLRGWAALDYFVFPRGEFGRIPPFLIGRACFDNWLVWRAREQGDPVVDATRSVVAVHQSHDYSHMPGGFEETYYGEEARYNERLAGGRDHIYSLHDASHRLYASGRPRRYPASTFRAREKARIAKARFDARGPWRPGRRPLRLLGVFPEPEPETTHMLDALAEADDVEVSVLYAVKPLGRDDAATPRPRYLHWFPRSIRVSALERALGRDYPINWAIWNSFRGFRPDCMLVSDVGTFATQAALVWCAARRIPYVLIDRDGERVADVAPDGVVRHVVRRAASRTTPDVATLELAALVRQAAAGRPTLRTGHLARWARRLSRA